MMYCRKTSYVKAFILFIIISSPILKAQEGIKLSPEIILIVNGSKLAFAQTWIDSLALDRFESKIYYKIIGASSKESSVLTEIQVPQILSVNEVYRQIVLYYSFLPDEDSREREFLNIHPYFESASENPALRCQYFAGGKYEIDLDHWHRAPVPDQPLPEDKDIYNQILQISFHEVQSLGDISDDVFDKVAVKNGLSLQQVQEIYQNTVLWQIGTQVYTK